MQWLVVVVNSILTGVVAILLKKITAALNETEKKAAEEKKHQEDERKIMRDVLLAVLKNSLYEQCFRAIQNGKITPTDKENIDSLYQQYHTLGGNHTGDILYRRVDSLELVPDPD